MNVRIFMIDIGNNLDNLTIISDERKLIPIHEFSLLFLGISNVGMSFNVLMLDNLGYDLLNIFILILGFRNNHDGSGKGFNHQRRRDFLYVY